MVAIAWRKKGFVSCRPIIINNPIESNTMQDYIVTHVTNPGATRILVQGASSIQDALTQAQAGKGIVIPGNLTDNWTAQPVNNPQESAPFLKAPAA